MAAATAALAASEVDRLQAEAGLAAATRRALEFEARIALLQHAARDRGPVMGGNGGRVALVDDWLPPPATPAIKRAPKTPIKTQEPGKESSTKKTKEKNKA